MKRHWTAAFAVLALGALAVTSANGENGTGSTEAWTIGDDSGASVSEEINVVIPERYALHLTEASWVVDLGAQEFPSAPNSYTYNANDPALPDEGCYLVPKGVLTPQDLQDFLAGGGELRPAMNYPAIYDYNEDGAISNDEKGTVLCLNTKILQKFSNNPDGWQLSVEVTSPATEGFGIFGLGDFIMPNGPADGFMTATLPYGPDVVAQGSGTTGGWLDDLILEGFWFNGTEASGTYDITVNFVLSSL